MAAKKPAVTETKDQNTEEAKAPPQVSEVFGLMAEQEAKAQKSRNRPMTPAHVAALHRKRLRLMGQTNDPKVRALVIKENAQDLGIEPRQYMAELQKAGG